MYKILNLVSDDGFASNCYLISSGTEYIVVDPSFSYEKMLDKYVSLQGTAPKYVLLTHEHYDHIKCINTYADRGVKILVSAESGSALSDSCKNCADFLGDIGFGFFGEYTVLGEGDRISFGDETLTVMKTPGHTEGSLCFIGNGYVIVGDTIFQGGSYGRCDLPGGNEAALCASLRRLLNLPAEYKIYPGHGSYSTIGAERHFYNL